MLMNFDVMTPFWRLDSTYLITGEQLLPMSFEHEFGTTDRLKRFAIQHHAKRDTSRLWKFESLVSQIIFFFSLVIYTTSG